MLLLLPPSTQPMNECLLYCMTTVPLQDEPDYPEYEAAAGLWEQVQGWAQDGPAGEHKVRFSYFIVDHPFLQCWGSGSASRRRKRIRNVSG